MHWYGSELLDNAPILERDARTNDCEKTYGKGRTIARLFCRRSTHSRLAFLFAGDRSIDCLTDASENNVGDIWLLDKVYRPFLDHLQT